MIQSELNNLKKMNSQILTNINSFLRKRLIESLGVLLILTGIFLLAIIISYSPDDPNFIYTPENVEINNMYIYTSLTFAPGWRPRGARNRKWCDVSRGNVNFWLFSGKFSSGRCAKSTYLLPYQR